MIVWFLAAISAAAPGDGWRNLKHVIRDRPYAVILRNKQCEYGALSSVGQQALVLATYSGRGVLIKRSDIARVTDNPAEPTRGAVFSGRSSWIDVKAAAPEAAEYLHIVTKDGEEWKWKQPTVSDDSITSQRITVDKADVRYVSYIRFKPLTVEEEFFHQEDLKWLAAIPLLRDLAPGRISVLLYNSDLPENNSPIACR